MIKSKSRFFAALRMTSSFLGGEEEQTRTNAEAGPSLCSG
jgi:hypothetical protein